MDESVLGELVARCLDGREAGQRDVLEALCREHPEHAAALRHRIALLEHVGFVPVAESSLRVDATEGSAPAAEFPPYLGEFTLKRRIGGGGMGVVYLARQESLGREVALKLIRPENAYFGGVKERFRREVEAVARFNHRGIVPIYTVGEENGIPYFAMEYVAGLSLAEVIAQARILGDASRLTSRDVAALLLATDSTSESAYELGQRLGPTWVQASIRITLEIADALAHAHARGVIHRDVKPSNVIVTRDGQARLVDFGLAAFGSDHSLTRTASPLGSPPYMAPEVCADGGAAADARTDVYALGVTLYELLTLTMAFRGEPREIMSKILAGDCVPPREINSQVPRDVESVCLKAMDLDQDRRYATAESFATDLRNLLELRPVSASRPNFVLRLRRFVQRRPALAMAALLAFFITVVFPAGYSQVLAVKNREIAYEQTTARRHRDATLAALEAVVAAAAAPHSGTGMVGVDLREKLIAEADLVLERLGEIDGEPRLLRLESGIASLVASFGESEEVEIRTTRLLGKLERASWRESPAARAERARIITVRLGARSELGRVEDAKLDALAALAIWRDLSVASPSNFAIDPDYRATLEAATTLATATGDDAFARELVADTEALAARFQTR